MAASVVLFRLLARASPVFATTVEGQLNQAAGNITLYREEIAPAWASQPAFRGTADIIWSCVVTLEACIYTTVHLNIPPVHQSSWWRLVAKAKWTTVALIGPELVLHMALKQLMAARRLTKWLNELHQKQHGKEDVQEFLEPTLAKKSMRARDLARSNSYIPLVMHPDHSHDSIGRAS